MEEVSSSGCILCCRGMPLLRCSRALRAHQNPGEWLNWRRFREWVASNSFNATCRVTSFFDLHCGAKTEATSQEPQESDDDLPGRSFGRGRGEKGGGHNVQACPQAACQIHAGGLLSLRVAVCLAGHGSAACRRLPFALMGVCTLYGSQTLGVLVSLFGDLLLSGLKRASVRRRGQGCQVEEDPGNGGGSNGGILEQAAKDRAVAFYSGCDDVRI